MKDFLIKISKYSFIAFILVNILSYFSLFMLSKSEFYKPSYLVNHFDKNSQFDMVVLGSSRGLTTIDTKRFDKLMKSKSVNLSVDDTSLPSHFLMLKHFFANGFKAKRVVLTLDTQSFLKSDKVLNDNDYRFAPFLFKNYTHNYYSEYEKENFKKLSLSRYFPVIGVSYYNVELFIPSIYSVFDSKKRNRFDEFGNYTYPKRVFSFSGKTKDEFRVVSNPLLLEMKKMCDAHQASLVIYIAPIRGKRIHITTELAVRLINHSNILDEDQYYYDVIHVNDEGRKLATDKLAKELRKI